MGSSLGRLRIVGLLEGLSYVLLVFVAMPLKYLAGKPEAVRILGSVHGALFMVLVVVLAGAAAERGWGFRRIAIVFVAALLPFGPFVIDRSLREEQALAASEAEAEARATPRA